ncbi:hypothetical protein GBF35_22550 [Nonomuraea phyllanthi]|nr:hypothetical protein GBF35_22550 [Nonomuraea phyllanthi]
MQGISTALREVRRLAERTPPSRERFIDLPRAVSIVAVVLRHWRSGLHRLRSPAHPAGELRDHVGDPGRPRAGGRHGAERGGDHADSGAGRPHGRHRLPDRPGAARAARVLRPRARARAAVPGP